MSFAYETRFALCTGAARAGRMNASCESRLVVCDPWVVVLGFGRGRSWPPPWVGLGSGRCAVTQRGVFAQG